MADNKVALSPVDGLKAILNEPGVQEQLKNAAGKHADLFTASLIDVFVSDASLINCDPMSVVMEAMKAATLKLPINKGLGFAYLVPFKGKAVMVPGYKGYIQLAIRTGQYRRLNAGVVLEGEYLGEDKLSGDVDLSGEATSEKITGYFAYFELLNGFSKTDYWTKEAVTAHGKRYSKSFGRATSAWQTAFDAMAIKTVVRNLISKYGIMSVEMISAISSETAAEAAFQSAIDVSANATMIGGVEEEQAPTVEPGPEPQQDPADFFGD